MSIKWSSGVFLFCLDLELFPKIKKDLLSTHSWKWGFSITQDLNKIRKDLDDPFVDIVKYKTCKISTKNIKLYTVAVGDRQSFQFLKEIISFLRNNRPLSKFK